MVKKYLPLDYKKTYSYFEKNIEFIDELIDERFCKYKYIKGKNKNYICGRHSKNMENGYCKYHIKYENKNMKTVNNIKINKYIKKDIIYCNHKSIRHENCKRRVKINGDLCIYHNLSFSNRKEIKHDIKLIRNMSCLYIIKHLNYNYNIDGFSQIRIKNNKFNIVITDDYKFIDNRTGHSGGGAIDLYMYILNKKFDESIKELNILFSFSSRNKNKTVDLKTQKIDKNNNLLLKEKKVNSIPNENKQNIRYVKDYLINKRYISKHIVDDAILNSKISADDKRNCIFYNEDKTYAFLRSTGIKKFTKSTGISNFIIYRYHNDNPLFIFESVIDILSYIDINNNINGTFISTNGNMMIKKVKDFIIKNDIKEVNYCFDNDIQGSKFINMLEQDLKFTNTTRKIIKPNYKDFNEDLKIIKTVK